MENELWLISLSVRQPSRHNWSRPCVWRTVFELHPKLSTTSITRSESALAVTWNKTKSLCCNTPISSTYRDNLNIEANWDLFKQSDVSSLIIAMKSLNLLDTSSFTESIQSFCIELERPVKFVSFKSWGDNGRTSEVKKQVFCSFPQLVDDSDSS